MDITKIYIVVSNFSGYGSINSEPVEFYLSRDEAEYAVSLKGSGGYLFNLYYTSYSVKEIPAGKVNTDDKSYTKFLSSKLQKTQYEIEKARKNAISNTNTIDALAEKGEYYRDLISKR